MKKRAVVNQIKHESELLEDRLLDKILSRVPAIVLREMQNNQANIAPSGRVAKDLDDLKRMVDAFNAFYRTEIKKIEEHLKTQVDEMSAAHAESLKKLLDEDRAKILARATEAARLDVENKMQIYRKDLLNLEHTRLPATIQRQISDAIDTHEANCIAEKCAVNKSDITTKQYSTQDLCELRLMSALSHESPLIRPLHEEDKQIYMPYPIGKKAHVSESSARKMLSNLAISGRICKASVKYDGQSGSAYWIDESNCKQKIQPSKYPRLAEITPDKILSILSGEPISDTTDLPWQDNHTAHGIAKLMGFTPSDSTAVGRIERSLQALSADGIVQKKAASLLLPSGRPKFGWAYRKLPSKHL